MSGSGSDDEWVFAADRDQLQEELRKRSLSVDGSDSVLALRLLRRVRAGRTTYNGGEGTGEMSNAEHLELPAGVVPRPDSPSGHADPPGRTEFPLYAQGPVAPAAARRSSASDAYNTMRKWNLHFSGARGEDGETFLLRIEEGRGLIPVSDADLLQCLPFFLTGMALSWYRTKRDRFRTWLVFKTAWRTRFGNPDFQFALRDEIMRRTQGESEPVADYFTCMNTLFSRLSPPWSEEEKVGYALRHMLPRLQDRVSRESASDLDTLELLAVRAESRYNAALSYRPPPPPEKSLFPDLAFFEGLAVDYASGTWRFADEPAGGRPFESAAVGTVASVVPAPPGDEGEAAPENGASVAAVDAGDPADATARGEGARYGTREAPLTCVGLCALSAEEQARLSALLTREIEGDPQRPGATTLAEHRIDVGDHAPIKQRYYPVSPKIREAIYEEVDKMLEAGIIEPSRSAWSTPIVMIKKPNGTYRFCLDFRRLNSVSKKDAYPLPYMNAILDKLRSARYISTIDLSQAYFQIPLERNSRELTAFTVPGKGLFHFTRMPYGLTGAPGTFQRLLDRLIGPEMEPHAFAYLDDIVIVTKTFDEHLLWLRRVFSRIGDSYRTAQHSSSP
ncbi:PREDICTED: uncharacterized protein LOC105569517 [Vollenhovia emeryi]|uniref:uncharacterized protein LOC105569517 n=1 Tax=Vollenhovia emeryi TaxID=411798 RepID=UPI0005F4B370|nr:PREDICTED: uncharacterized protein LOC105569517 [Vollenhovia emeryi]